MNDLGDHSRLQCHGKARTFAVIIENLNEATHIFMMVDNVSEVIVKKYITVGC